MKEAELLKEENTSAAEITIISLTEQYEYIYNISKILRGIGKKVDIVYLDSMKKKMKYANKQGCKYALIIGDDEIANNTFTLKNMENGSQKEIAISSIEEEISR